MIYLFNSVGLNPIEIAEKNVAYYEEFVAEYGCNPAYRVLWPGIELAEMIFGIVAHGYTSEDPVIQGKAIMLFHAYSKLYLKLTSYPFDATAPVTRGNFVSLKESVAHFQRWGEEISNKPDRH